MNTHLNEIGQGLNSCLANYVNVLIIIDFNSEIIESSIYKFRNNYNLKVYATNLYVIKVPKTLHAKRHFIKKLK